jgi:chromosome segregation ATPase
MQTSVESQIVELKNELSNVMEELGKAQQKVEEEKQRVRDAKIVTRQLKDQINKYNEKLAELEYTLGPQETTDEGMMNSIIEELNYVESLYDKYLSDYEVPEVIFELSRIEYKNTVVNGKFKSADLNKHTRIVQEYLNIIDVTWGKYQKTRHVIALLKYQKDNYLQHIKAQPKYAEILLPKMKELKVYYVFDPNYFPWRKIPLNDKHVDGIEIIKPKNDSEFEYATFTPSNSS